MATGKVANAVKLTRPGLAARRTSMASGSGFSQHRQHPRDQQGMDKSGCVGWRRLRR